MIETRKLIRARDFLSRTDLSISKVKMPSRNLAEKQDFIGIPKFHVGIKTLSKKKKIFRTISWTPSTPRGNDATATFTPTSSFEFLENKYKTITKKDQATMKLLCFLSIEFFFTNIPMAIVKIAMAFGYSDEPIFHEFLVLSIMLEISFAASNFYLYCFCNTQIRRKVKSSCSQETLQHL